VIIGMIRKITLVLILLLAMTLRLCQVDRIPPALSWDEVSIGYNAYSILKTGKDEHGRFLPFDAFTAYGDYKPPLAIYATVPFVALFGLNELAVRLPSVIFGTLTVLLTYYLVIELFGFGLRVGGLKTRNFQNFQPLALLSSFLLALSPWHINISRAGFEANIALFFVVFGIWLILSSRIHPRRWMVAWLPFVAAIYTFNSARYFSVFIGFALIVFTLSSIRKNIRQFVTGIIIACICIAPIVPHMLSKEARLRFVEVNIFTDASVVTTSNERIARLPGNIINKIVNNRRIGYARSYLLHFFDNLQPDFLFIKGDGNPKFSIQDVGQLYIFEAPFLAVGVFALLLSYPQIAILLILWIITAIIPAATARETPHALRILNSLPVWQIFIAYGILQAYQFTVHPTKPWRSRAYCLLLIALYISGVTYYLHNYYRHYPKEFSAEWQYGYREAIRSIGDIANRYNKIFITDNIGRPYMYTLFYTKTDPKVFQGSKDDSFDAAGFYHVYGFGKYRFPALLPLPLEKDALYIWDSGAAPKGARILGTIRRLDGTAVLDIFDNGDGKL
jgi:4-amino-4-deoxy-L-arabinose transferase-like glycosyltransferase